MVKAFDHYRGLRLAYYAQERRWPDALFWNRRQPSGGADAATDLL
jgi:hypothetical protein